jgi:hypothetical protein
VWASRPRGSSPPARHGRTSRPPSGPAGRWCPGSRRRTSGSACSSRQTGTETARSNR